MKDLYGNEVSVDEARRMLRKRGKRNPTIPKGYAAPPGTGPDGETCGSCRHLYRNHVAKTYLKCSLMKARWTGGAATDIRARSPACRRWEGQP